MSTKKENFKYAICYIPLVAIFLYFTEKNTSNEYKNNIKYWITLFIIYVIISLILGIIWMWWLKWLLVLAYIIISIILWYKAYNWEKVKVDILDNISETFDNKK